MAWRWALLALLAFAGCGAPPALGPAPEAFQATDALFTAMTARRPALVESCERRLAQLRAEGKLPEAAAERLATLAAEARAGAWEASARSLAEFIRGQRRE